MQWVIEDPNKTSSKERVTRRYHKKSKFGCQQCRTKKVKCDELRPRCNQCIRREDVCSFNQSSESESNTGKEGEDGLFKSRILAILRDIDILSQQHDHAYTLQDDEHILGHFFNHKELWFGTPELQRVMQLHGLRLAQNAPYLIHTLMSSSASHLLFLTQESKYDTAQKLHYTQALRGFMQELSKPITEDRLDILLAASIIHGPLAFLHQSSSDIEVEPFRWVRACRGSRVVQSAIPQQSWLKQSIWWEYIKQGGGIEPVIDLPQDNTISPWVRDVIEKFEQLCHVSITADESTSLYIYPLRYINKLLRMNNSDLVSSPLLRISGRLDIAFIELLEAGDPKALLIFCYWYGMMCNVKQWWSDTHAIQGCRRLCERLSVFQNPIIQELLEWPMMQAGIVTTMR